MTEDRWSPLVHLADANPNAMFSASAVVDMLRAATGWQPIETAPRDGTPVDLWVVNRSTYNHAGRRIINVKWGRVTDFMGRERMDWAHGHGEDMEPTHWMPLPPAPKEDRA